MRQSNTKSEQNLERHSITTNGQHLEMVDTDPMAGSVEKDQHLLSFFIPDLSVGGAEQVTVNIVNGLTERGYNVELLLSRFEGELQSMLAEDVGVVELQPSRTPVVGVAAHLPAIASYLRNNNPDVLIPHLTHPSVVCLTLNRILDTDTAIVPTHHSALSVTGKQTAKDRVVNQLIPRLYPSADRIIAVSDGVANSIVEGTAVDREQVSVLHNPVEIASVKERAGEPVDDEWVEVDQHDLVVFVGRLTDQKDLQTWLRTFKRVHENNPDTRGIIVGKGPQREPLQSFAQSLGIADVVSIPGFVDNPYRYMHEADTFLLSSKYEGLPTVLIEALACGCPVVSTDCPSGPREILADGALGNLAPVGDEAALAAGVCEMLDTPVPAESLTKRADDFSPASVLDDYERFLAREILAVSSRS